MSPSTYMKAWEPGRGRAPRRHFHGVLGSATTTAGSGLRRNSSEGSLSRPGPGPPARRWTWRAHPSCAGSRAVRPGPAHLGPGTGPAVPAGHGPWPRRLLGRRRGRGAPRAIMIYTSGQSADPKGAPHADGGLMEKILTTSPKYHPGVVGSEPGPRGPEMPFFGVGRPGHHPLPHAWRRGAWSRASNGRASRRGPRRGPPRGRARATAGLEGVLEPRG